MQRNEKEEWGQSDILQPQSSKGLSTEPVREINDKSEPWKRSLLCEAKPSQAKAKFVFCIISFCNTENPHFLCGTCT